jgi:phage protein D
MSLFAASDSFFRDPADCIVRVDDEEIAALYPFLREVTVEASRKEASTARLTFETQRDEHGRWNVQDRGLFAPWKRIVIDIAFGAKTQELFRGFIREVLADYPGDPGGATLTLECQDESLALDREHVRKAWGVDQPTSDAEIVRKIADKHALALERPPERTLENLVLYQNATDIQFLQMRAEANGCELYFRKGRLYFGPMQLDAEPQKTILVYAGPDTNCLSLTVRSDGHLPNAVGFDLVPLEGNRIERKEISPDLAVIGTEHAEAKGSGLGKFSWILSREGAFDEAELTARARQKVNDFSLRLRADGELDGALYGAVLEPGRPVAVDGPGEFLGGVYYVDSVSHKLDVDGYRQQIRLLRNAYGDNLGAGSGLDRLAGIR